MRIVKNLLNIRKNCQVLIVLMGLLLGIVNIGLAQKNLAERLIPEPYDEWVAGAAGNLFLRGPWIAKSWRSPVVRVVTWSVLSGFYEVVLDRSHNNKIDATARKDWWQREKGYLLTETLIFIGKKIF